MQKNAPAGTQIGTITANDPDGEIQTILSLDSRVEVSNGNILLTGDAQFNFEDPLDDVLMFEVIDNDGDKATVNVIAIQLDVDEETEEIA